MMGRRRLVQPKRQQNRRRFAQGDVERLRNIVDHRPEPRESGKLTKDDVDRIENAIAGINSKVEHTEQNLKQSKASLETYREQAVKPFEQGERLDRLQKELAEVERRLQGQREEMPT